MLYSDNGWLGDPTHGDQAFPSRTAKERGSEFFPQRFKKLNPNPKQTRASYVKIQTTCPARVKENHKKCWVPTILPDQREKWGTLFGI